MLMPSELRLVPGSNIEVAGLIFASATGLMQYEGGGVCRQCTITVDVQGFGSGAGGAHA
jgi:hypothetical protein